MVYTSTLVRIEGGSVIVESSRQIPADTSFAYGMEVASTSPRRGRRGRHNALKGFKSTGAKQRRRKR